jgi:hypothetical protein
MNMITVKVKDLPFKLRYGIRKNANVDICMNEDSISTYNRWGQLIQDVPLDVVTKNWFSNLPQDKFFELSPKQMKKTVVGKVRELGVFIPPHVKDNDFTTVVLNHYCIKIITLKFVTIIRTSKKVRNIFNNL